MATGPTLGDLVRTLREERGFTQDALAAKAVVSTGAIQRIEQAAARGEKAPPWTRRTLIAVGATLHRDRPLSEEQLIHLVKLSGVSASDSRNVESTIRKQAGEFDGLQDRLHDKGRKQRESLLDELLARQPKELSEIQAIASLMGGKYGYARTLDALRAVKAAFDTDEQQPQIKPPPGSIAHDSPHGVRILTPTSPPSKADRAKRSRHA